ncbi:MAG TPA: 16S rRNA (cytidine(1402)-2'-O)-methyltransferase [Kosmotogaceae bacterium]|nr:MAG: Ribosomal RNA small subunit methyltransferase I [Thermotogales bacterium 46_20]HAA85928.1 16S rRNA (cytidine(1402)-2'-O)-methyltransferase [Kosmotogaceae bacterium]
MNGIQEGCLWIVGTPIGNLEDISSRALRLLRESALILAEDTRRTRAMLAHFGIKGKTVFSLNQHNEQRKIPEVLSRLKEGHHIALVSDSGMPCISDPGQRLIDTCHRNQIKVDIVPGPSAVTAAISASGFPAAKVSFLGFVPRSKRRRRLLRDVSGILESSAVVFFDSPNRIVETLSDCLNILGDIDCFVAKEMTKVHQEFFRGTVSRIIQLLEGFEVKGEITVVLSKGGTSCTGS